MNTTTLLPLMMAALYYDPAILTAQLLSDFNRKCLHCSHKARCQRDLASGCAYKTYRDFCPNAEMLYLLQPWLEKNSRLNSPRLVKIFGTALAPLL